MEFDQTKTNETNKNLKYKRLLEWGLENGVLLKGVEFPASFENVTGFLASEDLPSNTAIICIPQSLIISPIKCKRSNLVKVYNSHPEMFDEEETSEADFNILTFYIFNEKKKGESSFYYPYIQAIQTNNTLLTWSNDDLNKIEDPIILEEFAIIKQDILGLWGKAKLIFDNNEDVFGASRITDKMDFYWAIECIMSRCFGWALNSTCLIPIADFLNHSNKACTHYMVHSGLEKGNSMKNKDKQKYEQQYILKRNKINLNVLGIKDSNEIQQFEDEKNKYIIGNKNYIKDFSILKNLDSISTLEKRAIINQIQLEQLISDPQKNVWDLDSQTSSDTEDNDSDEEIKTSKKQQFELLKIKELAEWKIREEQKRIEKQFEQISVKNQRVVTVTLNPEKKNKVIIRGLPQYQIEAIKAKQQMLNGNVENKENEQIDQNDSETSEESKWDWLDEYDEETYFCITTVFVSPMGEELIDFLYVGMDLHCLRISTVLIILEQLANQQKLWLNTDIVQEKDREQILNTIIIKKLLSEDQSIVNKISYNGHEIPVSSLSKEFRIKKDKLNMDVVIFLRLLLQICYGKENDLLSTIPISIDYEIFVMQFYLSLLNNLLNSYSQDLVQDLKELQQNIGSAKRFAIYINKERKEILINQITIVKETLTILMKFMDTKNLKDSYLSIIDNQMKITIVKGLKQYLKYLNEFL